jgi:hypothetical protein
LFVIFFYALIKIAEKCDENSAGFDLSAIVAPSTSLDTACSNCTGGSCVDCKIRYAKSVLGILSTENVCDEREIEK